MKAEHLHPTVDILGAWASEVGKGDPLDFEIFNKEGCFLSFEWEIANFTTYGHPLEKFRKYPLVALPWKKSFRRPLLGAPLKAEQAYAHIAVDVEGPFKSATYKQHSRCWEPL